MVVLDGASLTIDSLAAVAEGSDEVALDPAARDRMAAAREVVEEALRSGAVVYGLTTALAERKSVMLDAGARQGFSRYLIRGHLIAQGPLAPAPAVRAAMVCLVNGFAKGAAGVRPELAEMLVDALNSGLVPAVRSQSQHSPSGGHRGPAAPRHCCDYPPPARAARREFPV